MSRKSNNIKKENNRIDIETKTRDKNRDKRKSKGIKDNYLIYCISIILLILAITFFFASKQFSLIKYKQSIKRLEKEEVYSISLYRVRGYEEEVKNIFKAKDEYGLRLNINTSEYIDFKNKENIIYFEKDKKQLKLDAKKLRNVKLKDHIYLPFVNEEKKAKNIKISKKEEYKDNKNVIGVKYNIDNEERIFYLDKKTNLPIALKIVTKSKTNNRREIVYEYKIKEKSEKDNIKKEINKLKHTKYTNLKDEENQEYINELNKTKSAALEY